MRHAFFTRLGGVSRGPFESFNAAASVGDDPACVEENLSRASQALEVERSQLFMASQVHGRDVVVVSRGAVADEVAKTRADALASRDEGTALAVRTADCVPILLAAPEVGAACAVHAGWRGVELDIAARAVEQLVELGARANHILAAIGPHIGVDAFEVGDDVARRLAAASPASDVVRRAPGRRPHVDLSRIVVSQLCAAGLAPSRVERVAGCTHSDPTRFFSHRRDGLPSGRLLSAIVAPKAAPGAA